LESLLRRARPVLPLLQFDDAARAVDTAAALHAGGIQVLEVALRTPQALAAVTAIRQALPTLTVGVGTVTTPPQFAQAIDAGAQFAVSPGFSETLASAAQASGLPWLPGVMTASEVLRAREAGFCCLKLFPFAAAGGLALLQSLCAVFPDVPLCPSGGVKAAHLSALLAIANVPCVCGSWLAPADLIRSGDFAAIRHLAEEACLKNFVKNPLP